MHQLCLWNLKIHQTTSYEMFLTSVDDSHQLRSLFDLLTSASQINLCWDLLGQGHRNKTGCGAICLESQYWKMLLRGSASATQLAKARLSYLWLFQKPNEQKRLCKHPGRVPEPLLPATRHYILTNWAKRPSRGLYNLMLNPLIM